VLSRYLDALLRYVVDDAMDKKKVVVDPSEWTKESGRDVPQQKNGVDCGMFTIMFADYLTDDLPLAFEQKDIPKFRQKTVAAIMRGRLDYDDDQEV
jgi:sentrin-specific protease 1